MESIMEAVRSTGHTLTEMPARQPLSNNSSYTTRRAVCAKLAAAVFSLLLLASDWLVSCGDIV